MSGNLRWAGLADADLAGAARSGSLLVVGGGTSQLSTHMAHDGWPNVLDVDFSPCVVEQRRRDSQPGDPRFVLADARYMRPLDLARSCADDNFGDNSISTPNPTATSTSSWCNKAGVSSALFDACLDKGLVDALWCSGEDSASQIELVAHSVAACLKPGGKFIFLSYSSPEVLQPFTVGTAGSKLAALWSRAPEARKLDSLYLYVLERNNQSFFEEDFAGGKDSPPTNLKEGDVHKRQQDLKKHRRNRKRH